MNSERNTFWYVVYTKPNWEKKVAELLEKKGIEQYCPLNKVQKQWHDRKKTVWEPLFKSYVFVRTDEQSHAPLYIHTRIHIRIRIRNCHILYF